MTDTARVSDLNGWYEIPANPLSKTGVFMYSGRMIGDPSLDPNKLYPVYRAPKTLNNAETIDSFRLVPFINDHVMLGHSGKPGYVPAEIKGVHGVIGDKVYFDEADQTLKGNLKVFSQTMDNTIEGGKIELSCGFHCKYEKESGIDPISGKAYDYVQTHMRGNHLALVNKGRMGSDVAVLDHAIDDRMVVAFDTSEAVSTTLSSKEFQAMADKAAAIEAAKRAKQQMREVKHAVAVFKAKKAGATVPAMDAADDSDSEPSLNDIAELLADIMPVIGSINDSISPDDDMEDALDADDKPVMDAATNLPVKQKKGTNDAKKAAFLKGAADKAEVDAKAKSDKDAMDKAAMDKAAADKAEKDAMDAKAAKEISDKKDTGMDATEFKAAMDAMEVRFAAQATEIAAMKSANSAKNVLIAISQREALAKKLAPFVGVFDHSEMSVDEVAKYGLDKIGLKVASGHEAVALEAYLHGRRAPTAAMQNGMDAAPKTGKGTVADFLSAE